MSMQRDPDPAAPPLCRDPDCTLRHGTGIKRGEIHLHCPTAVKRQRYQRRRWARMHPTAEMDRRDRR